MRASITPESVARCSVERARIALDAVEQLGEPALIVDAEIRSSVVRKQDFERLSRVYVQPENRDFRPARRLHGIVPVVARQDETGGTLRHHGAVEAVDCDALGDRGGVALARVVGMFAESRNRDGLEALIEDSHGCFVVSCALATYLANVANRGAIGMIVEIRNSTDFLFT